MTAAAGHLLLHKVRSSVGRRHARGPEALGGGSSRGLPGGRGRAAAAGQICSRLVAWCFLACGGGQRGCGRRLPLVCSRAWSGRPDPSDLALAELVSGGGGAVELVVGSAFGAAEDDGFFSGRAVVCDAALSWLRSEATPSWVCRAAVYGVGFVCVSSGWSRPRRKPRSGLGLGL